MARDRSKAAGDELTPEERAARREKRQKRAARAAARAGAGSAEDAAAKKEKKTRAAVLPARGRRGEITANPRKVLVIGFQKTGTTTLTEALRTLGYSVGYAAQDINRAVAKADLSPEEIDAEVRRIAFDIADRADAVQDSPYPLLFKELDERYPGSKFIYLERAPDSWIKSVVGHFGKGESALRQWIYGEPVPVGHEEVYRQRFVDHRDEVMAYFADRPDDLLCMNLGAGDGWSKLVAFLGDLLPAFPHRNKRS